MEVGYPTAAVVLVTVAALAGAAGPAGSQQVTRDVGPVDVTATVSPEELPAGGTVAIRIRVRAAASPSPLPIVIRFRRPDAWRPRRQAIDAGRGSYVCHGPRCSDEHALELHPDSDGVAVATVEYRVPPAAAGGTYDVGLLVSAFPSDDVPLTERVSVHAAGGGGVPPLELPALGFPAKVATILGTLVAIAEFARRRRGRQGDGS